MSIRVPVSASLAFMLSLTFAAAVHAQEGNVGKLIGQGVASANLRAGSTDNRLPAGWTLRKIAAGSDRLENPSG